MSSTLPNVPTPPLPVTEQNYRDWYVYLQVEAMRRAEVADAARAAENEERVEALNRNSVAMHTQADAMNRQADAVFKSAEVMKSMNEGLANPTDAELLTKFMNTMIQMGQRGSQIRTEAVNQVKYFRQGLVQLDP